jgi:hypothetical protein
VNREERAKQFMPFDALKGLREELKKREEKFLKEPKRELSEQEVISLSQKIITLKKGDIIALTFFYDGHYITIKDKVQRINTAYKYIEISDKKIAFEDLFDIQPTSD